MKTIFAVALWFACAPILATEPPMPHVFTAGFTVVGISARTSNAAEATPAGKIGPLWGRFFSQHLVAAIPHRTDDKIVAVITDYASDENGDYTVILGARVDKADHLPDGMVARRVPTGNYALVLTDNGPAPQVVPAAWQRIWKMSPEELGGRRAFATDFEEYDEAAIAQPALTGRIYLSIK